MSKRDQPDVGFSHRVAPQQRMIDVWMQLMEYSIDAFAFVYTQALLIEILQVKSMSQSASNIILDIHRLLKTAVSSRSTRTRASKRNRGKFHLFAIGWRHNFQQTHWTPGKTLGFNRELHQLSTNPNETHWSNPRWKIGSIRWKIPTIWLWLTVRHGKIHHFE